MAKYFKYFYNNGLNAEYRFSNCPGTQTIQTVLFLRSSDDNLRHSDAVQFITVFTVVSQHIFSSFLE